MSGVGAAWGQEVNFHFFIHKYLRKWEQLELVLQHWVQA